MVRFIYRARQPAAPPALLGGLYRRTATRPRHCHAADKTNGTAQPVFRSSSLLPRGRPCLGDAADPAAEATARLTARGKRGLIPSRARPALPKAASREACPLLPRAAKVHDTPLSGGGPACRCDCVSPDAMRLPPAVLARSISSGRFREATHHRPTRSPCCARPPRAAHRSLSEHSRPSSRASHSSQRHSSQISDRLLPQRQQPQPRNARPPQSHDASSAPVPRALTPYVPKSSRPFPTKTALGLSQPYGLRSSTYRPTSDARSRGGPTCCSESAVRRDDGSNQPCRLGPRMPTASTGWDGRTR